MLFVVSRKEIGTFLTTKNLSKMKKTFLFAASLLLMASCSKEETIAPSIVQSTTISGSVRANLDLTNDTSSWGGSMTTYESAPSGVGVTITYDSRDLELHPDQNYEYQEIHLKAALDVSGNFSIQVPTIPAGVLMTVRIEDFYYNRRVWDYSTSPATKVVEPHLYQHYNSYSLVAYPDLEEQIIITMN